MTALTSAIDTNSDGFKANAAAMQSLVDELRAKTAEAAIGGSERSRDKHLARGKLLPRERVERLLDPGSPFLEIGALAANGMYEGNVHGAGMIAGSRLSRISWGCPWQYSQVGAFSSPRARA